MTSETKRIAITTLGCKTNQFETAAMIESLEREGFSVVTFDGAADVYVINSCTVTARTDAESRKLIRRAKRRNPEARVVVTGCYAQVAPEQLSAMAEVALVIGNEEKRRLAELLKQETMPHRVMVADIGQAATAEPLQLESFSEHTRAFLQVQNGCDSFCSYCIVPYARGRSRSVAQQAVLGEIALLTAMGFREIVLTGIHLGHYGRELDPPASLLELLMEIERQALTQRLRIGSLDPQDISPSLINFLENSKVVCPHLHIPLQSGSAGVLERMSRNYDGTYIRDLIALLIAAVPDICIGFDVIAGFPGETAAEFLETVRLIEELPISFLHVFPFSSRPGTKAAGMSGHLHSRVVSERAEFLRRLGEKKRHEYLKRFVGRDIEVLVLQRDSSGLWSGLSGNYLTVRFAGDGELTNRIVALRVKQVVDCTLMAELLPQPLQGKTCP